MTDQTIAAVYDTPAHAELAVQDLLQAGIPETAIHRHTQDGSYAGRASEPVTRTQTGTEERGFWASLFGGEPDHDTAVYDRSVATGGTQARDGETMQLAEERLDIGKRVVNRGTTRVRRFVVETPVEEQVNLRSERVTVERRPVSGGAVVNNPDFSDKTIELTEMSEEAVVSKVARVKEEIALRKEAADRTETVRETLRHEDVEIEKVPGVDVTPGARSRSKV